MAKRAKSKTKSAAKKTAKKTKRKSAKKKKQGRSIDRLRDSRQTVSHEPAMPQGRRR